MPLFKPIFGLLLIAFGSSIVVGYGMLHARTLAMKLGYGEVRHSSMAPFVGPLAILFGTMLFGPPLDGKIGLGIFLIDSNTYVFVLSLLALPWRLIKDALANRDKR